MKQLSDEELVNLYVTENSKEAFAEIYRRHLKDLYRIIYSRTLDRSLTEDVVSEAFYRLIEVVKKYNGRSKLLTFITGIAINILKESWRERKTVRFIETFDRLSSKDWEIESFEREQKIYKKLPAVLKRLKENYRQILELRFMEMHSIKEAAKILRISQSNVTTLQNRAIKSAQKIAQQLIEDENK